MKQDKASKDFVAGKQIPPLEQKLKKLQTRKYKIVAQEIKFIPSVIVNIIKEYDLNFISLEILSQTIDTIGKAYYLQISGSMNGADLRKTDLSRAVLEHTDLTKVNLQNANLTDAKLNGCQLSFANLQNCKLDWTKLTSDNFSGHPLQETIERLGTWYCSEDAKTTCLENTLKQLLVATIRLEKNSLELIANFLKFAVIPTKGSTLFSSKPNQINLDRLRQELALHIVDETKNSPIDLITIAAQNVLTTQQYGIQLTAR